MLLMERFFPGWGWLEIIALSAYASFIMGKMTDPKRSPLWRQRIWVLFSAVFFAQFILGIAGLEKCLATGTLHLPVPALIFAGPLFRGGSIFMVILFSATVLLVGPAWCSHLCYIGAWDAVAAKGKKRPEVMPKGRHMIRIFILLLVVLTALGLRAAGVPGVVATIMGGLFGLIGVAVMVFWSRKKGVMTHCVVYCPIGLIANWMGRISPFRIRIKKECTECGICTQACRYDALKPDDIKKRKPGVTCTLCGDCLTSCKDGWIRYGFFGLQPERARLFFLIVIVSLHAVFLGVARI